MNKICTTLLYSSLAIFLTACGGADVDTNELANDLLKDAQDKLSTGGANVAPTISGTPNLTVIQGVAYSFTPTANDENGDELTFTISNKPSWANFNSETGTLSGTPSQSGIHSNIRISVSDSQFAVSLTSFSITVNSLTDDTQNFDPTPQNQAPEIAGVPASSVRVGQAYQFTPVASDANDDTLSFTVENLPSWLTFNTLTGNLSGTPSSGDVADYSNIVISVSDGTLDTSLQAFTISVQALANQAPVISGTPTAVGKEDLAYSFTPNVSDPEDDTLTFSISNKPAWLSFNTTTGALTGTPSTDHVGSYSNIQISVSDGANSASLASFSIEVTSTSATLSWSAPSVRADGSPLPLSELSGYRLYSGSSPNSLSLLVDISDISKTEHKVTNLDAGTHYYAVSAYNINGIEGAMSDVVSKTIN